MKKLKNIYIVVLFSTMIIFLYSACKKLGVEIGNTNITQVNGSNAALSNIPFADSSTLAQIAQKSGYASYITARKMAIIDMQMNINAGMGWDGATLSQKPVVVYDGNSNPKYYEFIVVNQKGDAMGTITATAQKESDATVAYVLPYVRDYNVIATKGNTGYRLISNGYPNRMAIGIPGKSGDEPVAMIDMNTGQPVDEVLSETAEGTIATLKSKTPDQLNAMGINLDEAIAQIEQKEDANKQNAEEFWGIVDTLQAELDTMSDETIITRINSNKGSWNSTNTYIIPAYNTLGMRMTSWDGWCGPSVLSWIYRGLYDSYSGKKIPLYNDREFSQVSGRIIDPQNRYGYYNFNDNNDLNRQWVRQQSATIDGGLYATIAENSNLYWFYEVLGIKQGVTFVGGLNNGLRAVTNNKYGVGNTLGLGFIWNNAPHDRIRSSQLPLICYTDFLSHYVVAFGTEQSYWNWDVVIKIFGCKITLASGRVKTGQRLLVTDDGYDISKYGYQPFWMNDNITFNWYYPVVRNY